MVDISTILPVLGSRKIFLASASPRRMALLDDLGLEAATLPPPDADESYPPSLDADSVAAYISRKKADACRASAGPGDIVITADTVVIAGDRVLGKPKGRDEARDMLRLLSGKTHRVVTGVTLTSAEKQTTFSTVTKVCFDSLTDDEIEFYIDRYRPFDKAGAYGIQEWIGCIGVSRIDGCFYNVMGLPLHDLFDHLKKF